METKEQIYNRFYERNKIMISKLTISFLKSSNGVEEIVQEILYKILIELSKPKFIIPSEKKLIGWFYIVSKNFLIDNKRLFKSIRFNNDILTFEEINIEEIDDNSTDCLSKIIIQERDELIFKTCKNCLSKEDFSLLKESAENTIDKLCKIHKTSYTAMRSKLSRIRKKIQIILKEYHEDDYYILKQNRICRSFSYRSEPINFCNTVF